MDKEIRKERAEEILLATEKLYSKKSFKEISLKEISSLTCLTRTSIYNYYSTKEEIFLALLAREYDLWTKDLDSLRIKEDAETFSREFSKLLSKRILLLKILSIDLFNIEQNVSLEALVEFKKSFLGTMNSLKSCFEFCFPKIKAEEFDRLMYAFLPFMFGIYPYTEVTEMQKKAMKLAKLDFKYYSAEELIYNHICILLRAYNN